jgi:hypothetical protein
VSLQVANILAVAGIPAVAGILAVAGDPCCYWKKVE